MERRDFLRMAAAAAALVAAPRTSRAATARVDVLVGEPIGPITADFYGHFVEHLGGVVYDGIWVGEGSKIPNTNGIRQALVDAMRKLPKGAIRWPGGCFADSYDWRDGIGPRDARPRRTNFWAGGMRKAPDGPSKYDTNHFGTVDFARFCRMVGSEPYFAANLRSLPARDFYQWVEYCNSPAGTTSLGDLRAKDGEKDPLKVRYWGVGNESWGCGGDFTAEEYAVEFRRFTSWVPGFDTRLSYIASGPSSGELNWTRGFFSKLVEKGPGMLGRVYGLALHHYTENLGFGDPAKNGWDERKGSAVEFGNAEWYEILKEADRMDGLITSHWTVMGEFDPRRRVKLVVDEWGTWYKAGTELNPSHLLGQQNTMRDVLVAGLTLDTFHRHADKVAMANIAQLVNCLQSLFLADGDKFVTTPTYHVFDLYGPHVGGQAVRTLVSAPAITYQRPKDTGSLQGLSGSASVKDKTLTLTVTNPHVSDAQEVEIVVRGAAPGAVKGAQISAPDIHAHNTFAQPNVVGIKEVTVAAVQNGVLVHRFPPASVTRLQFALT
jgi:alpha-L-arabinofuranosidase